MKKDLTIISKLVNRLVLKSREKVNTCAEIAKYFCNLFDDEITSVETFQVYDSYGKKSTAYSNLQSISLAELMYLHRIHYKEINMTSNIDKLIEIKIRNKYTYILGMVWNEIKRRHPFKPGR